ncbi:MAG: NADH-quinone oxidoreductase subunit NuoH [Armatimonadetes bacterium]|nr:NADH-quinone oxidoreductase subunit NuoH [Armatimonadota bacterium]
MISVVLVAAVKSIALVVMVLLGFAYATLLERRLLARFQLRYGPNRAGPFGLLQPFADGIKLIFKESFMPATADRFIYLLAPAISMVAALFVYAVIPIGPEIRILGTPVSLYIADVNVGILLVLGASSIGVYGVILGGWSSNNKYALLGCLRSSAQLISYELAIGLAVVSVVLTAGSLSLVDIVNAQQRLWYVALQPVGFLLFFIGALAETNRAPFDLPEAEQELIAGFHTEYGGFKFAMFYVGEYVGIITMSLLVTTLFFGGWHGPLLPGPLWVGIKTFAFACLFIWIRATLPRVRHDQLMAFGWKVLIPIGLLNVVATAVIVALVGG